MKLRKLRMFGLGSSMLVGGLSIWLSAGFSRETRPAVPPAGMCVEGGTIALTPDAPQWQAVKLGVVTRADLRWTDPVPARIIAVATEGDKAIQQHADDVLYVPETLEAFSPLLASVPLQLFAYHAAVARGCNVDQPRNLAKSVTVE